MEATPPAQSTGRPGYFSRAWRVAVSTPQIMEESTNQQMSAGDAPPSAMAFILFSRPEKEKVLSPTFTRKFSFFSA